MAPWILPVIGLIPTAISLVEGLIGPKKGTEKKTFATLLIQALATIRGISTGAQAELWNALTPEALSPTIDALTGLLFPSGTTVTQEQALRMVASLGTSDSPESRLMLEKLDTIIGMLGGKSFVATVTDVAP